VTARLVAILLAALLPPQASLGAEDVDRPLLELGLAGGAGWFPDYPAASQNHVQGIVLPFLIYRGEVLRSDESGIRGLFLRGERVQLDVSLGGSLPADSDDNRAREDMPDLDLMGEIGPNLRFILHRREGVSRLDLDFGLRAAFTTDFASSIAASSSSPSCRSSAWTSGSRTAGSGSASARSSRTTAGWTISTRSGPASRAAGVRPSTRTRAISARACRAPTASP
jgi:hypothetical protein